MFEKIPGILPIFIQPTSERTIAPFKYQGNCVIILEREAIFLMNIKHFTQPTLNFNFNQNPSSILFAADFHLSARDS